jgi:hypothetical protein
MAGPAVTPVVPTRVTALQLLHPVCEVRLDELDHEVHVVAHQAVRMADPPEPDHDSFEARQEEQPVAGVADDAIAVVAARGHVVDDAGGLDAVPATHAFEGTAARTPPPAACAFCRSSVTQSAHIRAWHRCRARVFALR